MQSLKIKETAIEKRMGYSINNPPPSDGWDSGNCCERGGSKSAAEVISTDTSGDSKVLKRSQTLKMVEIFCSHISHLKCFSPNTNDNLSSFAGPFIAENVNKILKTVATLLQRRV